MAKRTISGVVVIMILALVVFAVFAMSMRRSHRMGGGSALDLVAVSAEGAQIPPSADVTSVTGELPKNTAAQKSGDLIALLALNPYPASVGQLSNFDVTLTDVNGQPIDDASISLDLTMPSMWMPPNQLTAEFVSDGKYHAAGQFTMRGEWRVEVIITRGAEKQSVFFDLGL